VDSGGVVAVTFTEEWFSEDSQQVIAELARSVKDVDGLIIEIGAWEGRSTIALANAIFPRRLHSVDTWDGSPGEPSEDLASQRDVHATWVDNIKAHTRRNVVEHRTNWRDYLPTLQEPIAFVFIDAEHSYREVFDNLEAVLPMLAEDGIVCGDDNHHPPVQQAVSELIDPTEVVMDASVWYWRKPPPNPTLEQRFRRMCSMPTDINEHLPRLRSLVEKSNAQHVVELGARSGQSTVAWLSGLQATQGRLTSVDLDAAPNIGEHSNWTHIQGDDTDPDVLAQVDECDILMVDTSHHHGHTLWELRNWGEKVRHGGFIVCHDTELERPWDPPCPETDPDFPVAAAIDEYCAERGYKWINVPGCWGLGIIKVRAK